MIRAIVFDIDNTLTDFMNIFDVYWKEGVEDQKIFDKVLVKKENGGAGALAPSPALRGRAG